MAEFTLEEVYRGEKYDVLSAVGLDLLRNGCPKNYDTQTWLEMCIVKHTLITAEKMKQEGGFVSGLTDIESLSFYAEGCENENT